MPIMLPTVIPFEIATNIGMPCTPCFSASAGSSSTLTLPKNTCGFSSATATKIGFICLHGPHHDAQKSRITVFVAPLMMPSYVAEVTVNRGLYGVLDPQPQSIERKAAKSSVGILCIFVLLTGTMLPAPVPLVQRHSVLANPSSRAYAQHDHIVTTITRLAGLVTGLR